MKQTSHNNKNDNDHDYYFYYFITMNKPEWSSQIRMNQIIPDHKSIFTVTHSSKAKKVSG